MKLALLKGALRPAAEQDSEELHGLVKKHGYKIGDVIEVEVLNQRNEKLGAKIHVTFTEIAKMLGIEMETFRAEVMVATGWAKLLVLRDGKRVWALPSMSRASMTQNDLEQFWNEACLYIAAEVRDCLPGEQQKRVNEMIDGVPA